jgi:hypothetical protein
VTILRSSATFNPVLAFPETADLPDPDELSHTQFLRAKDKLNEDKSRYARFSQTRERARAHGIIRAW